MVKIFTNLISCVKTYTTRDKLVIEHVASSNIYSLKNFIWFFIKNLICENEELENIKSSSV